MKLNFSPPNTEIRKLTYSGQTQAFWTRALDIAIAKSQSAVIHPTRKSNGDDISYPAIPQALSQVDIFGRALTHKPGIYPYGSATGTTPVTSTSLKAGEYKSAKANGKGVTKRKQNKLWGRYVPVNGITNTAGTSIDTGVYAVDNMEMFIRFKAILGSFYLLQSRQNVGSTIYGISGGQSGNTLNAYGVNSGIARTAGHIYTMKLSIVNRAVTLYVKDETAGTEDTKTGTATASVYPFPSPTTLKLFGDASMLAAGATVYRAYIKIDGAMAWDMYPCVDVTNSNAPVAYNDVTHAASTVKSGSITAGDLIQPIANVTADGTVTVDTGLIGSEKTKIVVDFAKANNTDSSMQIAGSATGSDNNRGITCNIGATSKAASFFGRDMYSGNVISDTNRHTLEIANSGYKVDGATIWTPSTSVFTTPDTLSLCAAQSSSKYFKGNLYPSQFYEDGVLVRDYLPVRIGTTVELLDLVNWQFATRTGTFTAGADLPYTQLCPDILETNAGDVKYGYSDLDVNIPGEYERVEYLQSSDTQYIDTGFYGTQDTKVSADVLITAYGRVCGSYNDTTQSITLTANVGELFLSVRFGSNTIQYTQLPILSAERHVLSIDKNGYYVDGNLEVVLPDTQAFTTQGTMWLFNTNPSNAPMSGKMYSAQIFDNSALVRNFIPVKKVSNNEYGMYDLVTGQFFGNSGTGAFTGGPVIPRTLHPSGEQTLTVGTQTVKIPAFLPSATSFLDAAKADNNVTCDWRFYVMTGDESITMHATITGLFFFTLTNLDGLVQPTYENYGECTHLPAVRKVAGSLGEGECCFNALNASSAARFCFRTNCTSVNEMKAELAAKYAEGEPWIIAFPLATPVTTTLEITPVTQPLGTVAILNEFADGTKGAVDFYGVNIQVDNPIPKPTEPYPLLSNVGAVAYGQYGTNKLKPSKGTAEYTGITCVGDGVKFHFSGTWNGNYLYTKISGDTVASCGSANVVKTYNTEPVVIPAGTTVKFIRKDLTYIRYMYFTTIDGDSTSFAWGATELEHTYTATTDITAIWFQWSDAQRIEVPCDIYIGMFDPDETEYEPYHFGWHGDSQQTVKMEGANLWNLGDFINGVGTQKTLEGLDTSKTYTILVKASSDYSTTVTAWSVSPRNADGTSRGNLFYMNDYVAGQTVSAEFTGAAMLRIQGSNFTGSFYICVIEGSATEWEPYVTPQTRTTTEILPSATSKLNMQGGNNNEECDFNFKQLDGTETWNEPTGYYYISLSGLSGAPLTAGVCTHFEYSSSQATGKFRFAGTGTANGNVVFYVTGQFATLTEWKDWLAANKPIVAYPTATPVKKTVATQRLEITAKEVDLTITSQFSDGASAEVAVTYLGDPEPPEPVKAVRFTAQQTNSTIALNGATGTNYKYSTDGETFSNYTSGTTITLANVGDSVWFQGVHNENVTYSSSNYSHFTMTGKIAASGNCNWLLDPDFADDDTLPMYCYCQLFYSCTSLMAAPDLPSVSMSDYCYYATFYGCTSLVTSPEISAHTIDNNSCRMMFYGCTSLITGPELFVETLKGSCYQQMFDGCTSLNSLTIHATTKSGSGNTFFWLRNVASIGTLRCPSALSLDAGDSGLPTGWTRVNI